MAATVMPSLPSPASASAGAALSSACAPIVGEQLGAVADDDVGGQRLAVADVAELDGGTDLAGGDVRDQSSPSLMACRRWRR